MMLKRDVLLRVLALGSVWLGLIPSASTAQQAGPAPLSVLLEPVPPFSYPDANGKPAGYAVELMEEMLKRSGFSHQTEFNSWARIYQRAVSHPHTLVVSMARLPEREHHFHWIGPTAARRVYLYRLKSRPEIQAPTLEAAKVYKIAVVREDAAERALLAQGFEFGKQLDRSPDHAAMLRKLFIQRDELFAANSTVAAAVMEQLGYDFKQIEPQAKLSEVSLYMGLSKGEGSQEISLKLQAAWDSMRKDGTVAAVAARHPYVVQAKSD
ncbi:transporter substrate-binding domain-containing protein [Roseateles oligotrophus]|uniref:Transporter substrate-binding domain-containing protein n=1 Tax=Roseateles oligotrophus TaxID=1769250 RepID=A0ABT2YD69_9BURK|nr:transporter substrate-binding domain-containing protein [Roseateles oligotrophus]MCV2368001.1 transporter substrate-binding domain-containing protein [Roseateles oligotrophus]